LGDEFIGWLGSDLPNLRCLSVEIAIVATFRVRVWYDLIFYRGVAI